VHMALAAAAAESLGKTRRTWHLWVLDESFFSITTSSPRRAGRPFAGEDRIVPRVRPQPGRLNRAKEGVDAARSLLGADVAPLRTIAGMLVITTRVTTAVHARCPRR